MFSSLEGSSVYLLSRTFAFEYEIWERKRDMEAFKALIVISFFDRLTGYFHAVSIPNGPFRGIVECSVGWWVEMRTDIIILNLLFN